MYKAQHFCWALLFNLSFMKNILTFLIFLCLAFIGKSQNIVEQLNNSVERANGGSGAEVEYHVYVTPTNVKVFKAHDWEKGAVVGGQDGSQYFELSRIKNGETETLTINLEKVAYMELEVKANKGQKEFQYKFYF